MACFFRQADVFYFHTANLAEKSASWFLAICLYLQQNRCHFCQRGFPAKLVIINALTVTMQLARSWLLGLLASVAAPLANSLPSQLHVYGFNVKNENDDEDDSVLPDKYAPYHLFNRRFLDIHVRHRQIIQQRFAHGDHTVALYF